MNSARSLRSDAREAYDATRDFSRKAFQSACYAPFVSLYFNPLGHVIACCRSQSDLLGNVKKDRLDAIWNGPRIEAMRASLAEYEFHGGCAFCHWMIDAGDFQGAMTHPFEPFSVQDRNPAWPKMMEFALSNVCNYECIQCCGDWSSTIRAHREGLPPIESPYGDRFFDELRPFLPHLERAKFFGGEPFLAKENFRIWDMMLEDGLDTWCHVLTNGSQWNDRVERVLDGLRFSVGLSIDAVSSKELFESIRVRGDYDSVMANAERLRAYTRSRGTTMRISFSWMRQNFRELGPMLMFAEERELEVNVIRIVDPPQFSLFSLPAEELYQVVATLEADDYEPRLQKHAGLWRSALASLREHASRAASAGYEAMHTESRANREDLLDRARTHQDRGEWAEAIALADQLEVDHKDFVFAQLISAHCRRRSGDRRGARKILDSLIRSARRRPEPRIERAWLEFDEGRYEAGLEDATAAGDMIDPVDQPAYNSMLHVRGFLSAKLGKVAAATRCMQEWQKLQPDEEWVTRECAMMQRMCADAARATREDEATHQGS